MSVFTTRRVAFAVVGVAALGASAYFAFRPTAQTASAPLPAALLLVDPRPSNLLPGGPTLTPGEIEAYRKTQAALVKSEFVTNAALRDAKARDLDVVRKQADAATWLAEHLTAEYPDGGSVLRVSVTGVEQHDAAVLANAVAAAYLNEAVQAEVSSMRQRLRNLEDTQAELTRALEMRRKELFRVASEVGVPPDRADTRALLASLDQERTGLRVELARVRTEKDACPEPTPREKLLRDELAALDARIKTCEQADLDRERAEVARLEAAVASVASEFTRLQLDLNSPARVRFLAPATVPGN
jgi:hypothetical protein